MSYFKSKFLDFATDESIYKELKAEHFDAGIAECIDPLAFAVFHRLGISTTMITTSFGITPSLVHYLGLPHPIGHPG